MTTDAEGTTSTVWDEWVTFRSLGRQVNHWDRPGWTEHTQSFHWFLSFAESDELRSLAEQCQSHLDDVSTLDLVPTSLLHLTIERLAFAGDVTTEQVDAVVTDARRRCTALAPFTVDIGPLTGSAGAVRFSVTPHEPIRNLRRLLMESGDDVLGRDSEDPPPATPEYIPHVTIAYSNADAVAQPIVERVEPLRQLGAVTVPVRQVELVRLRRDGRVYVWDPVASLALG